MVKKQEILSLSNDESIILLLLAPSDPHLLYGCRETPARIVPVINSNNMVNNPPYSTMMGKQNKLVMLISTPDEVVVLLAVIL